MSRATLLLVDDEERILRSLSLLLRSRFEVLTTTDGAWALEWVRERTVHVVVSDQRMPGMSGVDVLRGVRERSPATMRLLLTGYADLAAVEASMNEGEIFRFLEKPWDAPALIATRSRRPGSRWPSSRKRQHPRRPHAQPGSRCCACWCSTRTARRPTSCAACCRRAARSWPRATWITRSPCSSSAITPCCSPN